MTTAELVQQIQQVKSMSIVGMCKNAGKTTMLNWLLTGGHLRGTLGLTSIGRDGESTDVVTGTEKPGIFVKEGTLIATASSRGCREPMPPSPRAPGLSLEASSEATTS